MSEMSLESFLKRRREEISWRQLNGFDNGDPGTNGEYEVVNRLSPFYKVFVDIGANAGDFCKQIASISQSIRIEAFEANPDLIYNLETLIGDRGNIHQVAISNGSGKATLKVHPDDIGVSSLFDRTEMMPSFTDPMQEFEVTLKRLDDYYDIITNSVSGDIDKGIFIKIDIEGNELPAIKSAEKILDNAFPLFIMFEYSYGWIESEQKLKNAFHFLDNAGFTMHRITPIGLEKMKFFSLDMEDFVYCNYIAVKNFDLNSHCNTSTITSSNGQSDFYGFCKWI